MGWAQQEFETIDLGDPRLNRHAVRLAERLGQKPGASIPGACENWADTAAVYRFLGNEQVSCEDVVTAHRQATVARIPPRVRLVAAPVIADDPHWSAIHDNKSTFN